MVNLAVTYSDQGRWKEAKELEEQVMETSSTVLSMANLAVKFKSRNKEAISLIKTWAFSCRNGLLRT